MVSIHYANQLLKYGQSKYNRGFEEGLYSGLFLGTACMTILFAIYLILMYILSYNQPKENPRIIYDKAHKKPKIE